MVHTSANKSRVLTRSNRAWSHSEYNCMQLVKELWRREAENVCCSLNSCSFRRNKYDNGKMGTQKKAIQKKKINKCSNHMTIFFLSGGECFSLQWFICQQLYNFDLLFWFAFIFCSSNYITLPILSKFDCKQLRSSLTHNCWNCIKCVI